MLQFIGELLLLAGAFIIGATLSILGAYYKIEEHFGTERAKQFLDFLRKK